MSIFEGSGVFELDCASPFLMDEVTDPKTLYSLSLCLAIHTVKCYTRRKGTNVVMFNISCIFIITKEKWKSC
jgi:hypothetical protein